MALSSRARAGPLLYGALFVLALPAALLLWASSTEGLVRLTALRAPLAGWALAGGGLALALGGMAALRVWGGGLPMNAYPPPHHVRRGPYRLLRHPIYVGFGVLCAGVSVALGSASGLWLVTPVTLLAMAALVLGYEGPALRARFGPAAAEPPLLSLPADRPGPPDAWDRASVVFLVLLPWALAFEAVYVLGPAPDAVEAYFGFERRWPVRVWTEYAYAAVYPFVGLVPLVVRSRPVLRRFALRGLFATAVVTLLYLVVPLTAPPRPFSGGGLAGTMLGWERAMANTVAAFPSFHVIWTLLAADAWREAYPRARWGVALLAALMIASCITTGMHALADVALAVLLWPVFRSPRGIWRGLRGAAEAVANRWWEWRLGPVRILGYAAWAGLAGGVGAWITGSLVGPEGLGGVVVLAILTLLGACLWAQRLEGSNALSRPFGYFGSLVGATAGAVAAGLGGADASLLFAAVAMAAPWIQALGRLRCLAQGCCHGREAPAWLGIRYRDPRARAHAHAGFGDAPLHPTPLYSIGANVVIGVLLVRLWTLGVSEGLVIGTYLMLAGLARFVEEAYRGEPQTPAAGGLRLYQWLAVALLVGGAVVTAVARAPVPAHGPSLRPELLAFAALYGLLCAAAMGVDFPGSSRRFARLAPAEPPGAVTPEARHS